MSRDLRDYARKTNFRLGAGAFLLLFVVGLGLVYFVYGKEAAALGFFCMMFALLPVVSMTRLIRSRTLVSTPLPTLMTIPSIFGAVDAATMALVTSST